MSQELERPLGSNKMSASEVGVITRDTPLRLEQAAKLAFPDGSMKVAGLRREISRGRLAYEVIAGKQYTTLADIAAMRELCRVPVKAPVFGNDPPTPRKTVESIRRSGSSETEAKSSPQDALRTRLKLLRQKPLKSS